MGHKNECVSDSRTHTSSSNSRAVSPADMIVTVAVKVQGIDVS